MLKNKKNHIEGEFTQNLRHTNGTYTKRGCSGKTRKVLEIPERSYEIIVMEE